jgi:hypothetical protein
MYHLFALFHANNAKGGSGTNRPFSAKLLLLPQVAGNVGLIGKSPFFFLEDSIFLC